jgi:hypothetical protein
VNQHRRKYSYLWIFPDFITVAIIALPTPETPKIVAEASPLQRFRTPQNNISKGGGRLGW